MTSRLNELQSLDTSFINKLEGIKILNLYNNDVYINDSFAFSDSCSYALRSI